MVKNKFFPCFIYICGLQPRYEKYVCLCLSIYLSMPTLANRSIFLNSYSNQITFNVGQVVDSLGLVAWPRNFAPYTMLHFQYSQPTEFFRLPARKSLNLIQNIGYGNNQWNWKDYSIQIITLSEDFILYNTNKFYFGNGVAVGFQRVENERIGTKLLFGFKLLSGYKISDKFNAELFMQHFSNGETSLNNWSYNFWGLGVSYNF